MSDLFKMEMFKLRKSRLFWGCCIVIFLICLLLPVIGKIFSEILMNIVSKGDDQELMRSAQAIADEYSKPFLFSNLFRAPFGGLSFSLIFVFISSALFMHMDIGNGYIKNIAGQIPSRGYSCYGKYITVCIQGFVYMVCGFMGGLVGQLATRGLEFDNEIGAGILEFLLKWLLICGLDAVLLLFTTGFGSKVLGIVAAAILGTGTLSIIYMPLNFALKMLFRIEQLDISRYAPDQMLSYVNISVAAALIGGVALIGIFLPLTIRLVNKKDVK